MGSSSRKSKARFSQIPAAAIYDGDLTLTELRILGHHGAWNLNEGWQYISQSKLTKDLGVSRQTINASYTSLVAKNYLEKADPKAMLEAGVFNDLPPKIIKERLNFYRIADTDSRGLPVKPALQGVSSQLYRGCQVSLTGYIENNKKQTIKDKKSACAQDSVLTTLTAVMPSKVAQNYIAHRAEIKKPLTLRAAKSLKTKLEKFNSQDIAQAVEDSIVSGWVGVFPKPTEPTQQEEPPKNKRKTVNGVPYRWGAFGWEKEVMNA